MLPVLVFHSIIPPFISLQTELSIIACPLHEFSISSILLWFQRNTIIFTQLFLQGLQIFILAMLQKALFIHYVLFHSIFPVNSSFWSNGFHGQTILQSGFLARFILSGSMANLDIFSVKLKMNVHLHGILSSYKCPACTWHGTHLDNVILADIFKRCFYKWHSIGI